jgi:ABC-type amino acid transport system permease subunit
MERVIETVASGLGNTVAFMAETGILFVIFALIWVAFGAALIWSQGSIDAAWSFIRSLPLLVQALVWLLFLPVMLGLWVWETTWPVALRLLLVIGIGGWNLIVFLPRALAGRP